MTFLGRYAFWFIIIAVIYVLLPFDLFPEAGLGVFGLLDDILVVGGLYWRYSQKVKQYREQLRFYKERLERFKQGRNGEAGVVSETEETKPQLSPHEILEIESNASAEEIEAAYKKMMALYHPDKVAHLGDEIKELAHKKTLEIGDAYDRLK